MIRAVEFERTILREKNISRQIEDYCNEFEITREQIIEIKYTKANDGTVRASALLVYEED